MSHKMNACERAVETRLRRKVMISEQQYGCKLRKSTTDGILALRV